MQAAEFSGNKAKRGAGVFVNSQQYDPVLTVSALGADKQPVLGELMRVRCVAAACGWSCLLPTLQPLGGLSLHATFQHDDCPAALCLTLPCCSCYKLLKQLVVATSIATTAGGVV
jgi:hypothetical protein